jgi:hypothetical protein
MRRRVAAMALAGGIVAGCSTASQDEKLASACQFSKCDCVSGFVILDTKPILWQGDGRAGCPDGYRLRKLMVQ